MNAFGLLRHSKLLKKIRAALRIRVTFEDQQASRDYIQHPLHQGLLQSIGPFVEGIVVMDYPFAS
ncbi:Dabb family protein [uncultured Paenibacillus sp.]|uniref:Dabb family protein n=1 Tax=uncultured Paenibacillus sp. TaxID=227322 RepID=UPI002806028A|nr:Dabb family protein [uncultured Paenibacillus sp.]